MSKNIVVCCDGTGNEYGANNTNVVKLYEAIVRDPDQVAFYDPGAGLGIGRPVGRNEALTPESATRWRALPITPFEKGVPR